MAAPGLDETFRRDWPRIVGRVARFTGSLALAEDAVQEAFARAAASRDRELLINPAAWITTVAKRIAIDAVRRDARLRERLPLLLTEEREAPVADVTGEDERLGMLFAACTPQLAPETRLALALRFVCGVETEQVATAMLVNHTAMSARLTRAKRQIEQAGVRFTVADGDDLRARLGDVLATVHVLYTIGHTASTGDRLTAPRITGTAIELARALRRIAPDDPETRGLLALLLLSEARTAGRTGSDGAVTPLEDADRAAWDAGLIEEGLGLAALALPAGGRFALEAGISGLHSQAPTWAATDWPAICRLYDRLIEQWPSPAAQVARLVARSFLPGGLGPSLQQLEALEPGLPPAVARQAVAARADILRRLGRLQEARAAYVEVRSVERNAAVRDFFARRIRDLERASA